MTRQFPLEISALEAQELGPAKAITRISFHGL